MTLRFVEMGTENKEMTPKVVVRSSIPANVDMAESVSSPPADQLVERIGKDLAHRGPSFQLEPGVVPRGRLEKKVKHDSPSQGICANIVGLWNRTIDDFFYHASVNGQSQPLRHPSSEGS